MDEPIQMSFLDVDSGRPYEPCIRWGSRDTPIGISNFEGEGAAFCKVLGILSMCGGDAAFCQFILTTYLIFAVLRLHHSTTLLRM